MIGLAEITLLPKKLHSWDVNRFRAWSDETAMTIKTLLVEDHLEVRGKLRTLFMEESDIELVGEADNGEEALELIERGPIDVVVMDLNLPKINGIETAKRIVAERPDTKIIIISMQSDPQYVRASFEAGATGYVLKDCAFEELPEAVHIVVTGGSFISPEIEIGVP
jgi:DNA-binding NarL/FixJ family response regulator